MYTAIGSSFGATPAAGCESCSSFYSGGKDYCIGWQQSCPDRVNCCGTKEFYNKVYRSVKGADTWRWLNEKRVIFHVLKQLLDPSSGYGTGIDAFAWNAGKAGTTVWVDPAFVERVRRAANNFHSLLPFGRWVENPIGATTDPGPRGRCARRVSTYSPRAIDKNSPSYRQALNDVLTKSAYQDVAEKFEEHASAVIGSVPGSRDCEFRTTSAGGVDPATTRLLVTVPVPPSKGSGLTVVASTWLDEFLRTFAPPDPKTLTAAAVAAAISRLSLRRPAKGGQVTMKMSPQLLASRKSFVDEDASPGGGEGKGVPWVAVGVGVALAAGVCVLWYRGRRRRR